MSYFVLPYPFAPSGVDAGFKSDGPGEANADGLSATVTTSVALDATVGEADAEGFAGTATTTVELQATVGEADADGLTGVVETDEAVELQATVGVADADGLTANLYTGMELVADGPGEATADALVGAMFLLPTYRNIDLEVSLPYVRFDAALIDLERMTQVGLPYAMMHVGEPRL